MRARCRRRAGTVLAVLLKQYFASTRFIFVRRLISAEREREGEDEEMCAASPTTPGLLCFGYRYVLMVWCGVLMDVTGQGQGQKGRCLASGDKDQDRPLCPSPGFQSESRFAVVARARALAPGNRV